MKLSKAYTVVYKSSKLYPLVKVDVLKQLLINLLVNIKEALFVLRAEFRVKLVSFLSLE